MFRDDSIPELRRLLAVAHERIRELESREPEVVEVERVVTVQVEGPERVVYIENPDLERTIRDLQERLCQFTSASDS